MLLDTDVLLDFAIGRAPHLEASSSLPVFGRGVHFFSASVILVRTAWENNFFPVEDVNIVFSALAAVLSSTAVAPNGPVLLALFPVRNVNRTGISVSVVASRS